MAERLLEHVRDPGQCPRDEANAEPATSDVPQLLLEIRLTPKNPGVPAADDSEPAGSR